jgi:peptidoglycan-associated lipoprotein
MLNTRRQNVATIGLMALLIALLAGCASTAPKTPATNQGTGAVTYGTDGQAHVQPGTLSGEGYIPRGCTNPLLETDTFYFDFDQSVVKPAGKAALNAHAQCLANHPDARILLKGYTDDRGTAEYNLALGQRRANAVKDYLQALGVQANQVSTISYGEEHPAVIGQNQAAWAKNRRVMIDYLPAAG